MIHPQRLCIVCMAAGYHSMMVCHIKNPYLHDVKPCHDKNSTTRIVTIFIQSATLSGRIKKGFLYIYAHTGRLQKHTHICFAIRMLPALQDHSQPDLWKYAAYVHIRCSLKGPKVLRYGAHILLNLTMLDYTHSLQYQRSSCILFRLSCRLECLILIGGPGRPRACHMLGCLSASSRSLW